MAFNIQSWGIISGAANNRIITTQAGTFVGAPNVFSYVSATDTIGTIEGANYFGPVANDLSVGDLIYAVGTDTTNFLTVATVNVYLQTVTVNTGFVRGDVSGPASSVDGDFVLFNGTTGKVIKDSGFSIVPLAYGGTSAALTASNGGIFYSTATAGAILAGTATATRMLQSGANVAPAWSTSTWPATTTINQILYSSAANTVTGLATVNSAAMVTTAAGVPEFLALTDGQVIIGSSAGAPAAATITPGTGVTVTNGHNSITISSTAPDTNVVDQTSTPVTMAANTTYIADDASLITFDMPAVAAQGAIFQIVGKGAGGWLVQMNTGQVANLNSTPTSSAGSLASTNQWNCIKIMCVTANTTFTVMESSGVITVA